jgi:hypothetical protein
LPESTLSALIGSGWPLFLGTTEERLIEMFPGSYRHLCLLALDPYDLALSKLEKNSTKDRDDVRYLARSIPLDPEVLEQRYAAELRWQPGVPEREDLTLRLWIEMIRGDQDGGLNTVAN